MGDHADDALDDSLQPYWPGDNERSADPLTDNFSRSPASSKAQRHPSKKKLEALVERFNRDFPVGTEVMLRKDSGDVRTRIGSPAYMLGGHSPVAMFDGVSGAYSIEGNRVRQATSEASDE